MAGCANHAARSPTAAAAPVSFDVRNGVELHWLDGAPPGVNRGVSWGVPWPRGTIQKTATFALKDAHGNDVPIQTWLLAYWPDGSVKWTAVAATIGNSAGDFLKLMPGGIPAAAASPISVSQSDDAIQITSGQSVWRIGRSGANLVQGVWLGPRTIARNGRLVGEVEDRSDWQTEHVLRVKQFSSEIASAVLEQTGPERVVVKIEGKHKYAEGERRWLPFVVRLYFYAGDDSVRLVHTFIFDGDQEKDFIRALGVRFDVPMREEFQNRHVRLGGDQGFFAEPVRLIAGRRDPSAELYARQIAGKRIPNLDEMRYGVALIRQMPVWDAYKLTQLTPDGFQIQKRTNPASAWINVLGGRRSLGGAFVGDVSGGLSIDLRNFWQLWPTELEIEGAGHDAAELTVWLWSPEAPAMDLRHYDVVAHGLQATYEDVQPGFSSAYGVARTSELTLRPYPDVPSDEELLRQVQIDQQPPMLVCAPRYYHWLGAFGLWSLPDRSTPGKSWLEDELDKAIAFYQRQIEQRRWYGFWDFGDVMHTYDTARHQWKYDVGGLAWDNTELAANLWLWYSFLRTGRAEVYRMAEALTRQSQEVDVYHLGPWKGLGSRHNVRHWGDGAKELRISQSLFKRFYYYLSTDERMGDLMDEETDADRALLKVDPLRQLPGIAEEHKYPTHVRIGPDWLTLVGNWYAAWERTGDTKYRDWILAGMHSIASMPNKIASGDNYGYDPATHTLHQLTKARHTEPLLSLFGGPELIAEIIPVIDDPAWTATWVEYCQQDPGWEPDHARLTAYAAYVNKDPKKAAMAWEQFLTTLPDGRPMSFDWHPISGATVAEPIDEIRYASTNGTSQWCLNAIELLEMVPAEAPVNLPLSESGEAGRP